MDSRREDVTDQALPDEASGSRGPRAPFRRQHFEGAPPRSAWERRLVTAGIQVVFIMFEILARAEGKDSTLWTTSSEDPE